MEASGTTTKGNTIRTNLLTPYEEEFIDQIWSRRNSRMSATSGLFIDDQPHQSSVSLTSVSNIGTAPNIIGNTETTQLYTIPPASALNNDTGVAAVSPVVINQHVSPSNSNAASTQTSNNELTSSLISVHPLSGSVNR